MGKKIDAFRDALENGDHEKAKALYLEAMEEAKSVPDSVVCDTGKSPKFYKKRKRVELLSDGTWAPIGKSKK